MITDMVSTGNDVKKDISQVKNKTNWLNKLLIIIIIIIINVLFFLIILFIV